MGIIVCGLNGSGKSTLGRALAECLGWRFIDSEDLYFPDRAADNKFASPRTEAQFLAHLAAALAQDERFVYAAVKADHAPEIIVRFTGAVLVEAPRDVRLRRITERTLARAGARALPGGDLYDQEQRFYAKVSARPEDYTRRWLDTLRIPVLRVENTKPVEECVAQIMDWLTEHHLRCQ
ncbi:MAG: AAA family ATPase [Aristaeellaceae bacterium]